MHDFEHRPSISSGAEAYLPVVLASSEISFELDHFSWRGPDRLELSGTFVGLRDAPGETPVLVLSGDDETQRLPAVEGSGPPADGEPWFAEFVWQEAPVPFAVAALNFGDVMLVELPEPGPKGFRFRKPALKVHVAAADEPSAELAEPGGALEPAEAPEAAEAGEGAAPSELVTGTERVRLEAQLLVAQAEARELRAELEKSREELSRAREDLESDRARHAEDAQRFRDGLAQVQESAEAALAQLRGELEEAEAARGRTDERMAAFEATRGEAEAARSDAERLLSRLTAMRDAFGDDS
jgi:hypothetical protein